MLQAWQRASSGRRLKGGHSDDDSDKYILPEQCWDAPSFGSLNGRNVSCSMLIDMAATASHQHAQVLCDTWLTVSTLTMLRENWQNPSDGTTTPVVYVPPANVDPKVTKGIDLCLATCKTFWAGPCVEKRPEAPKVASPSAMSLHPFDAPPSTGACPAETLDLLHKGVRSGLCREDFCSPEISVRMCKDWTACRQALVREWGDEAGMRMDSTCYQGVHFVVILVVALSLLGCCCICVGVFIGVRCWRGREAWRSQQREERAGLTSGVQGATHSVELGQLPQGSPGNPQEDPLARIETLKKLLDAGAIGEGEYHGMKAEMLSRV